MYYFAPKNMFLPYAIAILWLSYLVISSQSFVLHHGKPSFVHNECRITNNYQSTTSVYLGNNDWFDNFKNFFQGDDQGKQSSSSNRQQPASGDLSVNAAADNQDLPAGTTPIVTIPGM